MSKVLIITNHSYMLYRFRLELIQTLAQQHEVVLCMPFVGHETDFQALGLRCIEANVDRRGLNPRKDWRLFQTYRKLLRQEQPDLVITYSIKPNIYGGLACCLSAVPFCANVQGLGTAFERKWLSRFVSVLYRAALRKAGVVFFENEADAAEFIQRKIVRSVQTAVLPGAGINLAQYPVQPFPQHDVIHFLYLGRIMKEKGMDELFAAMRRLYSDLGNKVILDLVGFYDDDDYKAYVQKLTEDGIAIFHGFQADPRPYYAAADCLVLPSYHEGMSNVLLEAAATGRPLITSDIPGCREAVENGVTGLLCKAKSADSLWEAMAQFTSLSRAQRIEMGLASRKRMEKTFDKTAVVSLTLEHLQKHFPLLNVLKGTS